MQLDTRMVCVLVLSMLLMTCIVLLQRAHFAARATTDQDIHMSKTVASPGNQDSRTIYDTSVDATVSISAQFSDDSIVTGSGFFIRGDGYICTCAHVVQRRRVEGEEDETDPAARYPELAKRVRVTISAAGGLFSRFESHDTDIVGIDGRGDVAVLHVDDLATVNPYLDLIRTNRTQNGESIMVIGDPFGRDFQSCAVGTIRDGQWVDPDVKTLVTCVLTDVSTSVGNSGSPIISTATGKCVGMHTAAFTPKGSGESTTFGGGVAGYVLCKIVDALVDKHRRPGVETTRYTEYVEVRDGVGYFRKGILPCALVANSTQQQMLMQAGSDVVLTFSDDILGFIVTWASEDDVDNIRRGDVITHINGIPVGIYNGHHSIGDVTWFLGNDEEVTLTVQRGGGVVETTVYKVNLQPIEPWEDVTDRTGTQVVGIAAIVGTVVAASLAVGATGASAAGALGGGLLLYTAILATDKVEDIATLIIDFTPYYKLYKYKAKKGDDNDKKVFDDTRRVIKNCLNDRPAVKRLVKNHTDKHRSTHGEATSEAEFASDFRLL